MEILLDDSTLVTLGHGVRVLARGEDAVQFGVDATRSGVVETPLASALSRALGGTDWPLTVGTLKDRLVGECRVDTTSARTLIDDLWSYRILVPAEPAAVAVLGTSLLAREITRVLNACGAMVRIPLTNEDTADFMERQDGVPVVVVDRAHEYLTHGRALKRHSGWLVPVLSYDSRVIVGPVARHGRYACAMCAYMHLQDRDEHFHHTSAALTQQPATMDPVVAAVGAAAAAVVVRRLCGMPDPPGVIAETPGIGWAAVVDPLGSQPVVDVDMAPHPQCPVCAAQEI